METKKERPVLVVAAAIVKGNSVLLARRIQPELPDAHLKWELPGGKVELEESLHQALVREIKEELDADIRVVRLLPHVQSNIYHGQTRLVHAVILAFESVIVKGGKEPTVSENSVSGIHWVKLKEIDRYELLPGTREFIKCLERTDRASYSSENIYVRLEKRNNTGIMTDFWEIRSVYNLLNEYNIIERHGNLVNKTTYNKVATKFEKEAILQQITRRIRSLVSDGYYIADSDDVRFYSTAL